MSWLQEHKDRVNKKVETSLKDFEKISKGIHKHLNTFHEAWEIEKEIVELGKKLTALKGTATRTQKTIARIRQCFEGLRGVNQAVWRAHHFMEEFHNTYTRLKKQNLTGIELMQARRTLAADEDKHLVQIMDAKELTVRMLRDITRLKLSNIKVRKIEHKIGAKEKDLDKFVKDLETYLKKKVAPFLFKEEEFDKEFKKVRTKFSGN